MAFEEVKGDWEIMKGSLREKWGKLTDNDLEIIKGDFQQLGGHVQKAYGITKAEAEEQVAEWKSQN